MATRNPLGTVVTALALSCLLALAGCGGEKRDDRSSGSDSSASPPPASGTAPPPSNPTPPPGDPAPPPSGETVTENRVTGSVGDGPIVRARLRVRSNSGQLLMETESSNTADYSINVKTQGRNYAVTIEADQGIDLVTNMAPDFKLVSAIIRPNTRTISNLNPYTTLIFGTSQRMGGINDTNVAIARDAIVDRYGFGLDKAVIADPTSTPIDGNNVHVIVKTSETLGEMIRRTRDALVSIGWTIDGDIVVGALNADLTDGWVDGQGALGSDARIAAVANVASAAVMVQALANRLHVYGYDATRAMDDAIVHIRPNRPASNTTANVAIPAEALQQTIRALEAAARVVNDPRIAQTIEVVRGTPAGAKPADIAPKLPSGIDKVLDEAVLKIAGESDALIDEVNFVARNGGPSGGSTEPPPEEPAPTPPPEEPAPTPPPEEPAPTPPPPNNPPTISGTPQTTAKVDVAWSFQPSASDPDGDKLTFSVQNKPAWLSFDAATGRLWGTPTTANVGTHLQIGISVTDGTDTAHLTAFDLVVEAPPPPPNNPPVISGSPTTTTAVVGSPWSFTPTASDPDGDPLTFTHQRQARVDELRQHHRTPVRHAGQQQRGRLRRHRDLGERRESHCQPLGLHPDRDGAAAGHRFGNGQLDAADRARRRDADHQHQQVHDLLQPELHQTRPGDQRQRRRDPLRHREPGGRHLVLRRHRDLRQGPRKREIRHREQDHPVSAHGSRAAVREDR
jgi:hypothetical protein